MKKKNKKKKKHESAKPASPLPLFLPTFNQISSWPYGLIAFVVLLFYSPLLLGAFWPWDDAMDQHYSNINYAVQQLKAGVFPWWSSFIYGGMPYAGDMQTCLFYPIHWLMLLPQTLFGFSFVWVQWYVVFHLIWMGWGQYKVLRDFDIDPLPCLFGALGLVLSGHITGHFFHFIIIYVTAWMPWTFLYFRRILKQQQWKDVYLSALCLGLSMLGGFAQYSVHFFYFLAAYAAFFLMAEEKKPLSQWIKTGLQIAPVFILATSMATVQYLLTLETADYSPRAEMTFEFSSESTMWFGKLITFLIPNFFGNVMGFNHGRGVYWGEVGVWMHWEAQLYIGVVLLAFSILGFHQWKSKTKYFLLAFILVAIAAALARMLPVYKIIYNIVPALDRFRGPARGLYYVPFCVSILASMGLHHYAKSMDESVREKIWRLGAIGSGIVGSIWLLLAVGFFRDNSPHFKEGTIYQSLTTEWGWQFFILALFVGLLYRFRKKQINSFFWICLLLLFAGDLYRAHGRFNLSHISPAQVYQHDQAVQFFQKEGQKEKFRINTREGRAMLMSKNQGMVHQLFTMHGNNQMRPRKLVEIEQGVPMDRVRDLFNVKYEIVQHPKSQGWVWQPRPQYQPRFWFADSFEVLEDTSKIFARLSEADFPYMKKVVLSEPIPNFNMSPADSIQEHIEVQNYTSSRIQLLVKTNGNKLLIASENYFPAWRAKIDGFPQKIYEADRTFWAIPISEGTHQVEFYFSSSAFHKGAPISALAWLVVLSGIWFTSFRSWRVKNQLVSKDASPRPIP